MALKYKIDIPKALREKGYTAYYLINSKTLSSSTMQKLRTGVIVDQRNLDRLCALLDLQPGDLIEHVKEDAK